jgi:hypothetical protein
MELRRGVRYPVELDCRVSGLPERGAGITGKTVNMSRCGVLVSFGRGRFSSETLKPGDAARVVLELPDAPYFRGCWLDCTCRAVRVEELPEGNRMAFDVVRYRFRPSPRTDSKKPRAVPTPA